MSSAPVEPLPDGRCPLCGARNRDDAQWCVQCLARFGVPAPDVPEPELPDPELPEPELPAADVPEPDDVRSGSRRGVTPPDADEGLTGILPRPRRDRDDTAGGQGAAEDGREHGHHDFHDDGHGDGREGGRRATDETANRLLAQLRAHEAQRPWGGPMARRLGLAGPPWMRAAVGAVAVLVVLLVAMWVLGHFVQP